MRSNERPETITRSYTNRRISAGETSTTARASPKAVQINPHTVPAAFGHLHAKFAQVVPCAAHVVQIGWHMKFHRFLRMQRFMSSGRPLGSRYRMPTGITLMVSIVENAVMSSWRLRTSIKSRDGTEQEERSLCDKDNGPRRVHNSNH